MATSGWIRPSTVVACGVLTMMLAAVRAAAADDPLLAVAYGNGVHAYHAGDYQRSHDDLTSAIEAGSSDPRAYYFRGLAALKLGRLDEAEADFAAGSEREAAALGNWHVPRSLERIQGADRLQLERYRVRARMVAMQRRRETLNRRYSDVDAAQDTVLRRRRPESVVAPQREPAAPADELPAPAAEPEAEEAADDDLAGDEAEGAADKKGGESEADLSGDEPAADADTPFGDETPAEKDSSPLEEGNEEPSEDNASDEETSDEKESDDEASDGEAPEEDSGLTEE